MPGSTVRSIRWREATNADVIQSIYTLSGPWTCHCQVHQGSPLIVPNNSLSYFSHNISLCTSTLFFLHCTFFFLHFSLSLSLSLCGERGKKKKKKKLPKMKARHCKSLQGMTLKALPGMSNFLYSLFLVSIFL